MRALLVSFIVLLLVPLAGISAELIGVTPATGEQHPQQRVDFGPDQASGVYYVADSYGLQNVYLRHGGSLSGTFYLCNESNADQDGDGSVDASAECVSIGDAGADFSIEAQKGVRRFLIVDIDTAEDASTPSKLTIFGTNRWVSASAGSSTSSSPGVASNNWDAGEWDTAEWGA